MHSEEIYVVKFMPFDFALAKNLKNKNPTFSASWYALGWY
jgi:hypothetical protein